MLNAKPRATHLWDRADLEWYVEPPSATAALLTRERFSGDILDPCCGQGNIVRTLRAAGYEALGADLVDRAASPAWFWGVGDFLEREEPVANICMNPPFYRAKGTEAFIRHALRLATAKVAAFVDIRFAAGGKRADGLFAEYAPHRIWIVTPRVSCPPGEYLAAGNKAGNGSSDWCWMVWDRTAPFAGTSLGWVRRPDVRAAA